VNHDNTLQTLVPQGMLLHRRAAVRCDPFLQMDTPDSTPPVHQQLTQCNPNPTSESQPKTLHVPAHCASVCGQIAHTMLLLLKLLLLEKNMLLHGRAAVRCGSLSTGTHGSTPPVHQ
jgi:hypothetical protein